jgi:hypothetical protein
MRHSDMNLTNKTYTDASALPTAEAMAMLPSFLTKELGTDKKSTTDTHIADHEPVSAGHSVSHSVTRGKNERKEKALISKGSGTLSRDVSQSGTSQNEWSRGELILCFVFSYLQPLTLVT